MSSFAPSALPQVAQQLPARQAKNASMSVSVPTSPLPLKSAEPQVLGSVRENACEPAMPAMFGATPRSPAPAGHPGSH